MLVALRILGLAVVITLGFSILAWVLTRERKWLRISWLVFKYAVYALAFVLLLFAGEALLTGV